MNHYFEDLRPYVQEEIAPAMKRIAGNEYFEKMAAFVFPDRDVEEVRKMVASITTTYEFQAKVMSVLNRQIIKNSIRNFTYDGLQYLDPDEGYLFVSNHRDIMLDSALLQQIMYENGRRTTEITFGSNLMISQLIIDIGKSNKMFTVVRGANMKDFYRHSMHLSEYIRYTITHKRESVWIAQRNGRTKDGNDATDQGIIKMFAMSSAASPVEAISELKIVPVSVSYQIEPCDLFKTKELYLKPTGQKYQKQPGEDFAGIMAGITEPKGDVNISICRPLCREELIFPQPSTLNDFFKNTAALIDRRIYDRYRLSCNNYIAHDLRSETDTHAARYTEEEKQTFMQRYHAALNLPGENKELLKSIFLGIYANPVDKKSHPETP
ncbi:MAG: acyltransferase [Bacteroidales bacterium]|jgi:hypothetical protein|nr:acyltransferase [Bacteroidales bacterium]